MKKKKNKFKNPHYSPRKRLPARRRSPRSFIAKYISTRNCGIAFRVINASELVFAAEAAVNPTDLLDFKSEDTIERVEVVDYDAVGGESTENNAVGGEGTENNADGVESTENNAVGVERRRGELFLESATVSAQLDESEKFFIGKRHTMSAINGDIVRIRVMSGHDAEVTEILQRSVTDVMGIVYQAEDELGETVWVLEPDDKRLDFSVIITEVCEGLSPKDGDKAVARITEYPEYTPSVVDSPLPALTET